MLEILAVLDALLAVALLTVVLRVIAAKIRALLMRRRNRRWVRNRPRPVCPDVAGRGRAQITACVVTRTVITGHNGECAARPSVSSQHATRHEAAVTVPRRRVGIHLKGLGECRVPVEP